MKPFFSRKQAQLKALAQQPSETFSAEEEQQLPAWYHGQTKRKTQMYKAHHVEQQGIAELLSFAQSLKKDYEAVKSGLTLKWSQGPVEGHVHRKSC